MVKASTAMKRFGATKIARGKANWGSTVVIKGKRYDKPMIDAAKWAVKGAGDGRISAKDVQLITKAVRPSGDLRSTYDSVEKATMAYLRTSFKFTPAGDKACRAKIAKLAAKQAARTKAKKAMK
mmetsp:Transcript_103072/g.291974  ORF Transcript_103072/g.291974 Transcript_103072/m.291974 type:complete len:124 (-) Transcript_103072:148-519(-)|eukprot:CAMPEP_0179294754 /NCGR_PEP_ID=MMETSP0797-20121207/44069_1 /TAXON_ID=47934 /ORGANISM="Dinophysis acuminata, Strain DAEP01" /LENGTH=123 /DNA_ID=CAMNT_0021003977 /DNA_START=75 /DNA_END=446 /DNA_ORIENTATION=-